MTDGVKANKNDSLSEAHKMKLSKINAPTTTPNTLRR